MRILIVDDEQVMLDSVHRILRRRGYADVQICNSGRQAVEEIKNNDFDVVLLDIIMPEMDGLQVLEATRSFKPMTEFIIVSALEDVATTVRALRLGAYDYIVKPLDIDRLILAVERAFEHRALRMGVAGEAAVGADDALPDSFRHIVTVSSRVRELLAYARTMVRSGKPILVTGESGTGKELLAQAIHNEGPGENRPFVAVNMTSIPEALFESQFFGHRKGAFTGAETDHRGYFEQADGGTLFLDEIGDVPLHLQPKLLRALENQAVTPLGETRQRDFQLRVVSSTNSDLNSACRQGRFRLDLLYRINAIHIHLPPLRERREDIPVLARHFLEQSCRHHQMAVDGFSPEAMAALERLDYPGNIRELGNMVDQAVMMAKTGLIDAAHLNIDSPSAEVTDNALCTLKESAERHVYNVIGHTNGDLKAAAGILGISLRQVQRRLADMRDNPKWRDLMTPLSRSSR